MVDYIGNICHSGKKVILVNYYLNYHMVNTVVHWSVRISNNKILAISGTFLKPLTLLYSGLYRSHCISRSSREMSSPYFLAYADLTTKITYFWILKRMWLSGFRYRFNNFQVSWLLYELSKSRPSQFGFQCKWINTSIIIFWIRLKTLLKLET